MIRIVLLILLLIRPELVFAGGDYIFGRVLSFSGENGNYSLTFKQTNVNDKPLIMGCYEFKVNVKYENIPWYSWLPFVQSTHPTKEQTVMAASLVLESFKENREIGFGYMGSGLMPTKGNCTFASKGMVREFDNVTLSFHDPV